MICSKESFINQYLYWDQRACHNNLIAELSARNNIDFEMVNSLLEKRRITDLTLRLYNHPQFVNYEIINLIIDYYIEKTILTI